jgi:hypothetical protein
MRPPLWACSANSSATGPKVMIEYDDARNADGSQSYSEMRKMMAFRIRDDAR